jgi:hypothetical protein
VYNGGDVEVVFTIFPSHRVYLVSWRYTQPSSPPTAINLKIRRVVFEK